MNKIFLWIGAKCWDIKVRYFLNTNTKKFLNNRIAECEKLIEEYINMLDTQKQFVNMYVDLVVLHGKLKCEHDQKKNKFFYLSPRMKQRIEARAAGRKRFIEYNEWLKSIRNNRNNQDTEIGEQNEDFVPVVDTSFCECGCGSGCDCGSDCDCTD